MPYNIRGMGVWLGDSMGKAELNAHHHKNK